MSTMPLDKITSESAPGRAWEMSYNLATLLSLGIVAIGAVVAIYGLAIFHGASPNELGLMVAYP
jgi:hypothetical protein